jgi:CPA1 family monovalent cation:H+ antiporter
MFAMMLSSLLSSGTSATSLVDQVEFLILLLTVTLVVALLSRRLRVPYTLLLVIVGFVVGLLPFLPHEHLDPSLVLYVFIPALLFEGAWNAELDPLEADLPVVHIVFCY